MTARFFVRPKGNLARMISVVLDGDNFTGSLPEKPNEPFWDVSPMFIPDNPHPDGSERVAMKDTEGLIVAIKAAMES
ncbi:MAG TPA: hypothetical protein VGB84_00930 [Arachidicoccus sp.]